MENFDFDFYESLLTPCKGRVLSSDNLLSLYLHGDNNFLENTNNFLFNVSRRGSTKEIRHQQDVANQQRVEVKFN